MALNLSVTVIPIFHGHFIRRSFRLGVPGRLVLRLVEMAQEQEHGHALHIVTLLNRLLKQHLDPVMKDYVSLRYYKSARIKN